MIPPDAVLARPVISENFLDYGKVYDLTGGTDPGVIWIIGSSWNGGFTRRPLIEGAGYLGITQGGGAPWFCTAMERHPKTEEAILCAAGPVLLAVALASGSRAPHRDVIEAFVIAPGQAVVMRRNVWHDVCRGLSGPTPYYWMAVCGRDERPWEPVEGGPRAGCKADEGAPA